MAIGNPKDNSGGSEHERLHAASSIGPVVQEHLATSGGDGSGPAPPRDGGKAYGDPAAYRQLGEGATPASTVTLRAALAQRRSVRSFGPEPVAEARLGTLLGCYTRTGELATAAGALSLRSVPSAGGMFPVEVYIAAARVTGLPPGTYHYRPDERAIALIRPLPPEGVAEALATLLLDAPQVRGAAGAVLLTARFSRAAERYGERAYRYALLEAGHIAQTLALGAVDAGLGAVFHGAFYDRRTSYFLGLDGVTECVVGVMLFGTLPVS